MIAHRFIMCAPPRKSCFRTAYVRRSPSSTTAPYRADALSYVLMRYYLRWRLQTHFYHRTSLRIISFRAQCSARFTSSGTRMTKTPLIQSWTHRLNVVPPRPQQRYVAQTRNFLRWIHQIRLYRSAELRIKPFGAHRCARGVLMKL